MKKLFLLLLCLAALAGFVLAGAVGPPGEIPPALPGYGVGYEAVAPAPGTVPAVEALVYGFPGRIIYTPNNEYNEALTGLLPAEDIQRVASVAPVGYPLLC
jgi:hypothetical protein